MKQNRLYSILALIFYAVAGVLYNVTAQTGPPQHTISGTVTDALGPITGVNVILRNQNSGTFTDGEGKYRLMASPTDTLVFTYLGYRTVELHVGNHTEINVKLQEEATTLQEVEVNAGYYTVKERERTGSISRVTAEEIELQPIVSPLEALQGRMAGVEVTPNGNLPGMAPTVRIRGTNSLREEGNFPLYIIDGVPINSTPIESNGPLGNPGPGIDPLNTLNLNDIESIEVLKDADATAIYGSRGANGVVLITTKKGLQQKIGMQARLYSGMSSVPNRLSLLNTEQYLRIRNKAFENDGVTPTVRNAPDLVVWDQNRYTDWQDVFLGGTSFITDVNLSTSGSSKTLSYRLSGSYHKQGTVFPGDANYNRVTSSLNLNHTSENKKFIMNIAVNYGVDLNNLMGSSIQSNIYRIPPNAPEIFNEDGSLHWEKWTESGRNNPFEGFLNSSRTQARNLVSNLGLSYLFFDRLTLKTNLGYTTYASEELIKRPKSSYNPASWAFLDHQSSLLNINRRSWIIEPQLSYNSKIGTGTLNALFGGTFLQSENRQLGLTGIGYATESLIGNLTAAERLSNVSSQNVEYRYNAIFGRLGFSWADRYFLNLTGRRDGSSRFGPYKQYANFGAVGGAWIFSKESFVNKHLPFLSFGKLRGSFGTTGNDQIGDYGYLDSYEATRGPGGLYPTILANPNFSWEVNKKLEAAIELGFLSDRINFGLSWYRNRSSNQLVGYSLPSTTGFTSVQANLPATVQNTGWELEFSTLNFKSENFRWQTSLNVSFPENKLLSYPDIEQSSYVNTYKVGRPLNIALLYHYDGIDPEIGIYKIADVNVDGRLDYQDRVEIRDRGRKYFGGINNVLKYKNLSVQFLWQFVKQEGRLALFDAGMMGIQREIVVQALEEGSQFQQISTSIGAILAYNDVLNSDLPYTDASFLRLKTVSLGYHLPTKLLQNIGVRACKLFINGQNLFTITNYEGMDPEMSGGTGTTFGSLRTITLGVQLNF